MGKTYACSDLHGMLDFFNKIVEMLEPDDTVYFLGDAGDRGPDSWETIKKVYEHPQFIYLKGNHEDMLIKALKEYQQFDCMGHEYRLLHMNGGVRTFEDCLEEENINDWIVKLDELPVLETYVNKEGKTILLSHAGFTPYIEDKELYTPSNKDLIWDRTHYYSTTWREYSGNNNYIVHGHTPMQYLKADIMLKAYKPNNESDEKYIPFWYCEDHKCCIDSGAFFTKQFCLLDLDTFEYYHFTQ